MSNRIIYGLYDDDHKILEAAKQFVGKGVKIKDVYSPFPIYSIDKVLGVKWTRLAVCAFMFGLTGTALALLGVWYFMIYVGPLNIGGKPSFDLYQNIPAFIPVVFEFTVLCAGHGMVITMLFRNWTLPGVTARNPHPRTTDDHFAMEIHTIDNSNLSDNEIEKMLKDTGAVEVFDSVNKPSA